MSDAKQIKIGGGTGIMLKDAQARETLLTKADKATTLAGYGITNAYTKDEVDAKITAVYKPAGSVASVAELGALSSAYEGYVYNMSADFTTTSDFIEGAGKEYPAGTNVMIIKYNNTYKYDVMSGMVDLSGYTPTSGLASVALNGNASALNYDSTHRAVSDTEKSTWNGKYAKPSGGIPSTDMSSAVQTSLGKADSAVQDISGKADKDTDAVEGNLAKFDSSGNPVDAGYSASRIHRDLGYNALQNTVVLTAGVTGKYVKCSTRAATANANFNISAPFDVEACSELLIKTGYNPSDNDHASLDISVISIYEEMQRTRTVQAKNSQNQPLYYEVDDEGNPTSTQTTEVTPFPVYTTETYTESRYLPNNEDRFVQIPDSGYYVANIPQSCKCVISYKPGVTDLNVIVVKHGALANLTSQIFGIYEHRTMSEAVTSLATRIEALEARIKQPGDILCGTVDAVEYTKLGYPQLVVAVGAPSANLRPTYPNGDPLPADLPWDGIPPYIGHMYLDMTTNAVKLYFAKGISAISDYIPLN